MFAQAKDKRLDVVSRNTRRDTARGQHDQQEAEVSEKARRKDREAQAEKMSLHIAKSQKTPIM